MNNGVRDPLRGDIWFIDFDPVIGSELQKTRPAVVISSDAINALPVKLVVPFTDWKDWYASAPGKVLVPTSSQNGLRKKSAADVLQ